MKHLFRFAFALAAVLTLCPAHAQQQLRLVDAHSQASRENPPEQVVELMRAAGVSHTILSARGGLGGRDLLAAAARYPSELSASVPVKGDLYNSGDPRFAERLADAASRGRFRAISEALVWHAQKGRIAPRITYQLSDPPVMAVLQTSIEHGWPFVVHIEFRSAGAHAQQLMADFKALAKRHPRHPFVLIHMGQLDPQGAAALIRDHPNVHFMTSHANPVYLRVAGRGQPWINMFDGRSLKKPWRDLMVAAPNRFILAFDCVLPAHFKPRFYVEQASLWRDALSELPPSVANAVAHGNAERLWRLP